MNKLELIHHVAAKTDLSLAGSQRAIDAVLGAIKTQMKKGGDLRINGFGSFTTVRREARAGRNPRNGKPIKIAAKRSVKFIAGKDLREAIN